MRQVTEARVLAALAHPLRSRLLEVLKVHGPQTVGLLAGRTGERVGSISHHMGVLAACELVAEVPDLARDRRERWWGLAQDALRWSSADFPDSPELAAAAGSLGVERHAQKVRDWIGQPQTGWTQGPFSTDSWATLSDAELAQVCAEVVDVFARWRTRPVPEDGAARRNVFLFAHGVPAEP